MIVIIKNNNIIRRYLEDQPLYVKIILLYKLHKQMLLPLKTFQACSFGNTDGVRPQHMMDMVSNRENGHALAAFGHALAALITSFVNMLLEGNCHSDVIPICFGGCLIALEEKFGGIRPIAIGYTLHRNAAKCANNFVCVRYNYFGQ